MTYDTKDEAKNAVEMFNGTEFNGQKIGVEFAKRKSARDKTPGKYLGRSRRRRSLTIFTLGRAIAGLVGETEIGTIEGETGTETIAAVPEIAAETGERDQGIAAIATETTATEEIAAETGETDQGREGAAQKTDIDAGIVLNNL